MIMWCYSPAKLTAMKKTTRCPLLNVIFLISAPWTKYIHLVSKTFQKIYFIASIRRDSNWNSKDYITIFWHGSEGVVKTGLEKGFKWRIYPVPNGSHISNSLQDKIIGPGQCLTVQVFVVQLCDFSDVVCNMTMHTCHLWLTCTALVKCQLHFKGHLSMVICSTQIQCSRVLIIYPTTTVPLPTTTSQVKQRPSRQLLWVMNIAAAYHPSLS